MTDLTTDSVESDADAVLSLEPDVIQALVDNHSQFLNFLTKRVGRRDVAEEILQEAFVRGIDRADTLRDNEAVTAWFYRLLRNALVDHWRRRGAESRALEKVAQQAGAEGDAADDELMNTVCGCVGRLVDTLKPEYAEVIRRVDLDGTRVIDYATSTGISANHAGVRLHRARQALRRQVERSCGTCAEHGCLDCHCKSGCHDD